MRSPHHLRHIDSCVSEYGLEDRYVKVDCKWLCLLGTFCSDVGSEMEEGLPPTHQEKHIDMLIQSARMSGRHVGVGVRTSRLVLMGEAGVGALSSMLLFLCILLLPPWLRLRRCLKSEVCSARRRLAAE